MRPEQNSRRGARDISKNGLRALVGFVALVLLGLFIWAGRTGGVASTAASPSGPNASRASASDSAPPATSATEITPKGKKHGAEH